MTSLTDSLEKLRLWTEIDVKSPNTKNTILRKISADTKNPFQFDMDFYQQHKERYSMLGQTNLELLQLSKPWRVNLTVIKAIYKFKRGLKKQNHKSV
tara:strand:- start:310 stop:600 length:291 start_codon:yes stop_codon:yes gene_type:complete